MQLPVYTQQVQKTAGGDAKIVVPGNIGAAGMLEAQGIKALNQGLGAVNAVLFKQAADADKTTATAANNEYTKRLNDLLYNDKDGLLHTQMKGADGITSVFEEKEKQIREEVAKKYKYNFNAGRQEFDAMASRAYAQRLTSVQNHMYAESKKYRDVEYSNAIDNQARFAAENYADSKLVDDAIAGALANVDNYFAGQGEEVLEQQRRRIAGQIAGTLVSTAISKNDWTGAQDLLTRYGASMDTEKRMKLSQIVSERIQTERDTLTLEEMVKQYKDPASFMAAVEKQWADGQLGEFDNYVMATQGANIDEQVKQLTPEFRSVLPQIGGILKNKFGITGTISSGGRTYEHQMEVNPDAPNSWHIIRERGGDAVDIVLPDEVTAEQAKAILHYFENSGAFAEVLYHDVGSGYHLHLGGYKGGLSRKTTPTDKKRFMDNAMAVWNKHQHMKNMQIDAGYKGMENELLALRDAGNANWKDYTDCVERIAGGDPELRKKGYQAAQYWYGTVVGGNGSSRSNPWGGGSGGSGKGLALGDMSALEERLRKTNFENKSDWSTYVLGNYNPTPAQYERLMNLFDQKVQGKGEYAYDWAGMEKGFRESNKLKDGPETQALWREAKTYAIEEINKLWEEKHREPTYREVQQFLIDSLNTVPLGEIINSGFLESNTKVAPRLGWLADRKIKAVRRAGDMVEVVYKNKQREWMNLERFNMMMNPETATLRDFPE